MLRVSRWNPVLKKTTRCRQVDAFAFSLPSYAMRIRRLHAYVFFAIAAFGCTSSKPSSAHFVDLGVVESGFTPIGNGGHGNGRDASVVAEMDAAADADTSSDQVCNASFACPTGYFCHHSATDACGAHGTNGVCIVRAFTTTGCNSSDVVCGCDLTNYLNECQAWSVGVEVAYGGLCAFDAGLH